MASNLVEWVHAQLQSAGIADGVALLVLAALEGDKELNDYIADGTPTTQPEASPSPQAVEANGVVLTSIKVEGFRGIGPASELQIAPKPGLTIVAGRNGSGKSSFSEALELVLTGDTYRWKTKNAEWRNQWRNIHHPRSKISLRLVEEGVGPISVNASWADGESTVGSRMVKAQAHGQPQRDGTDHLGWKQALEQFRPILSYDELGGMLDGKQSDLYDALASILGVEQLTDAVRRLKAQSDARKGPGVTGTARRKELQARAAASSDERAVEAAVLLRKANPDTGRLRALVTGGQQVARGPLSSLRVFATITAPDAEHAAAAVARLREAKNSLADAGAAVSARNRARLKLLDDAIAFHATHGDQSCPVCRTGNLDATWAETSRQLAARERKQFADVEVAHQNFDIAFEALQRVVQPTPVALDSAPLEALQTRLDEAKAAWAMWAQISPKRDAAGADALMDHVEIRLPKLRTAVTRLNEAASVALMELDDQWQPLATAIAAWCDAWDGWKETEPTVSNLQAAEKWLKDNDLRLKNERLAPIESQAKAAWQRLRQESNVELGSLQLTGIANRRKVKVTGAIDGESVDSFAVFSQGELHALTLSLFLPRATLAQSPFRFVVLDDPVQAMDPAKVDGLVELLGELSKTRQVIVFSHDDRLAAALRRSSYDATILEVTRGVNSAVAVQVSQDPATRYLDDAHGLIREWEHNSLTEEDLRKTLPGLFRFAIESAAMDRYFATQLATGASIHDLEQQWRNAQSTKRRVNLAVFGEQPAEHISAAWTSLEYRKKALGVAAGGFHKGLADWVDPETAHHNAKRLVDDIRRGLT